MKGDKSIDVLTMTILQSVRVLATEKDYGNRRAYGSKRKSRGYNTITLELYPKEVEMIVFAAQKGRLILSLRSFNETGYEKKLQSVNFRYLEEHLEQYNKERQNKMGGY
jgi:Flp pilus assembly protein CpaB